MSYFGRLGESGVSHILLLILLTSSIFNAARAGKLNPWDDDDPDPVAPVPAPVPAPAPAGPKVYSCPADNGAPYTTNGVTFILKCGQGTKAADLRVDPCDSQSDCADMCAKEPACQSCDWNSGGKYCHLFKEYIPTIDMPGVNTWFPVTKRPDPKAPIICPGDDKKEYTAPGGKLFTIRCQTHTIGESTPTSKIKTVKAKTLEQCMDACAGTTDCKSVDFVARPGGHVQGDCDLYKLGGSSTYCSTKNVDTAWTIDPPAPAPAPAPAPCGPPKPKYTCPADDRKTYTSENGKNYMLKCDYQSPNATPLKNTPCTSMTDCAEQCSKEDESVICDWSENNCAMKKQYIEPFHQAGVNTWIDIDKTPGIDPPFEKYPDEGNVVCSTECPAANGVTHDSPAGERFHIDCGRRHAVKPIYQDYQETLKDCINACGALLACHSVDWNKHTKVCYYGQHHGEPQQNAAAYGSAHTLGCAGGCKQSAECKAASPA